ncbi:hypothetical protein [Acinetobacter vivianii]|uniref:hypothetical protein n=1 Tax=Acinetobacter vivianii TaxID=1776742 RepID=UPI002DBFEE31|nr:hypothetical protein [Acinetobacter vivianii]MEB6478669.1 hypothetical protein [Acinetobacter vivianii]MEB6657500.1 hypothetical protein [Acinetobacter vivianii]
MSVFFERKLDTTLIENFIHEVFNIKNSEIKVFEQDNFFNGGYLNIDEKIKCLCTYRYLNGDAKTIIDLYRIEDQSPKTMVERLKKLFGENKWDGGVYIENIDGDYLFFNNSFAIPVLIDDDNLEDNEVFFTKKY